MLNPNFKKYFRISAVFGLFGRRRIKKYDFSSIFSPFFGWILDEYSAVSQRIFTKPSKHQDIYSGKVVPWFQALRATLRVLLLCFPDFSENKKTGFLMPGLSFFLRFSTNFSETETESFLVCFTSLVAFSAVSGYFKGVFRIFQNFLPKMKKINRRRSFVYYSAVSH